MIDSARIAQYRLNRASAVYTDLRLNGLDVPERAYAVLSRQYALGALTDADLETAMIVAAFSEADK